MIWGSKWETFPSPGLVYINIFGEQYREIPIQTKDNTKRFHSDLGHKLNNPFMDQMHLYDINILFLTIGHMGEMHDLRILVPGSRSCTRESWSHFPCSWWERTSPPVSPLSSHQRSCCSRAGPPRAPQRRPSTVALQPMSRWLLLQAGQYGPLRADGSALTCCCCRGRWRLFRGCPCPGRSWGSAEAVVSAVSVAREGAPSGHGAGRNSGSSACPGCAGCIRPRTHSTMRRCWKTTLLHLSWNGSWGCDFQCLLMFKACSLLVFYFDIGRFLKVCYCLAIREGKSKRRINPIDANKCLKPLSSKKWNR